MPRPDPVSIYHITHVDNLASMVAAGGLHSDARMIGKGGPPVSIGIASIKTDRLTCPVRCHPGAFVGEYVPFNFCPRSVMLYVIYMKNHPALAYRGGQDGIVHLEARLDDVAAWAAANSVPWAFTLANARAGYAEFRDDLADLDDLDWAAIGTNQFAGAAVQERKQSEFLVHGFFPWNLFSRVGVHSDAVCVRALQAIQGSSPPPAVDVVPGWYFP